MFPDWFDRDEIKEKCWKSMNVRGKTSRSARVSILVVLGISRSSSFKEFNIGRVELISMSSSNEFHFGLGCIFVDLRRFRHTQFFTF